MGAEQDRSGLLKRIYHATVAAKEAFVMSLGEESKVPKTKLDGAFAQLINSVGAILDDGIIIQNDLNTRGRKSDSFSWNPRIPQAWGQLLISLNSTQAALLTNALGAAFRKGHNIGPLTVGDIRIKTIKELQEETYLGPKQAAFLKAAFEKPPQE